MTVYQLVAKGHLACFGGSTHSIASKELYTAPPGDAERTAFRERCVKCEGGRDLFSLDPDAEIIISTLPLELVDNGDLLATSCAPTD